MRDVLALHCSLGSGAAWRPLARALPEARLACPDLPGHGAAPDWDGRRDYGTQALDLALASAPAGAFDLVGHSLGGALALRLLADRPARIRSLTLVEPVMFAAADPAVMADHWQAMAPFRAALDRGDTLGAAGHFHDLWGDGRPFDALPDRARAGMARRIHLIPATEPGIVDDVHSVLPRLPRGAPPVLLAIRRDPPPVMAAIAAGLAARLPQARVVHLGRGHMIPMEVPGDLAAVMRDFWNGTGRAGRA